MGLISYFLFNFCVPPFSLPRTLRLSLAIIFVDMENIWKFLWYQIYTKTTTKYFEAKNKMTLRLHEFTKSWYDRESRVLDVFFRFARSQIISAFPRKTFLVSSHPLHPRNECWLRDMRFNLSIYLSKSHQSVNFEMNKLKSQNLWAETSRKKMKGDEI